MMTDLVGVDLEELESELYSQVYHSYEESHIEESVNNIVDAAKNNCRQNIRYFQHQALSNSRYVWSNDQQQEFISLNPEKASRPDPSSTSAQECWTRPGTYNLPSSVGNGQQMVANSHDNTADMLETQTHTDSHGELVPTRNKNFDKFMNRQKARDIQKVKRMEKFKKRREKKKQQKKEMQMQKQLDAEQEQLRFEFLKKQRELEAAQEQLRIESGPVIFKVHTISKETSIPAKGMLNTEEIDADVHSDEGSCIVVPDKSELIVLSSDDEDIEIKSDRDDSICCLNVSITKVEDKPQKSTVELKNDDDVIFVEPEPKEIEVIDIDCESIAASINSREAVDERQPSSETNSTGSDILMKIPHVPPKRKSNITAKERSELINTPDSSVSNDFLDNFIDLQQDNFNFSLHGSDFGSSNNLSKSKVANEMSETESSCSASDMSTPIKSNVFNEIEFETPNKQLFQEGNLELFGSYITPNRVNNEGTTNDVGLEQIITKASAVINTSSFHDSSDSSSSESDYDEGKVRLLTNFKHLSELSTVDKHSAVDEEDNFIADEDSATVQLAQDRNEGKRKTEEVDSPNKKQKVEEIQQDTCKDLIVVEYEHDVHDSQLMIDCNDDLKIENHSDLIVLDEISDDENIAIVDSDDTESYFSCDEFNNVTADLTLANISSHSSKSDVNTTRDLPITLVNSSVEAVQRTMSDDPDLWKILDVDRLHFRFPTPGGPGCHRCREVGHVALHCTSKQGPPACTLCGGRDHVEPRCPEAMCTSCGRLGGHTTYCGYCANWRNVQCRICKLYGHIDSVCPDSWRRYHLTTKPGPIVKPAKADLKAEKDRWCSGCAQSGHFESSCPYYNRTHFAVYPDVKHYVDLYNFPKSQPFIIYQEEPDPPKPSTSSTGREKIKTLKITLNQSMDRMVNVSDLDQDDTLNGQEDSFHDAESGCSEKTNYDEFSKLSDEHIDGPVYFSSCFPPPDFIPPYFRKQMTYLRKQYLQTIKQSAMNIKKSRDISDLAIASTSSEGRTAPSGLLEDYVSLDTDSSGTSHLIQSTSHSTSCVREEITLESSSFTYQRKSSAFTQSLKLDHYQFAYIHSKRGINLLNNIRRYPGIHMIIEKYDESPAGEMTLNGSSNIVVCNAKQEIVRFLRAMPRIQVLPLESRQMIEFLQLCKERLDKAEGNCWTLYKKLCRIRNNANKSDLTPQVVKLKSDMQVTIQMLLYGKLKLENGSEHLAKIQEWIRVLKDRSNHQIPLNDIFDLYESYSYLFEPRKTIYPYKNLCAQHDHYILPTVDSSKRRRMPEKNRGFVENKSKFVIESCKKYNLPNKFITELMTIQKAMQASQYSRVSYGDFLRFLKRFKAFMKKNKIM